MCLRKKCFANGHWEKNGILLIITRLYEILLKPLQRVPCFFPCIDFVSCRNQSSQFKNMKNLFNYLIIRRMLRVDRGEEPKITMIRVSHAKQYFVLAFSAGPFELWDIKKLCLLRYNNTAPIFKLFIVMIFFSYRCQVSLCYVYVFALCG